MVLIYVMVLILIAVGDKIGDKIRKSVQGVKDTFVEILWWILLVFTSLSEDEFEYEEGYWD